ncbi:transposase [Saccharothrix sp. HUAS TT1]|uniref:transposase n=1 Tax=unclassified Saccharothrix TaxID=2593673 RepID=UPI00345BC7F5
MGRKKRRPRRSFAPEFKAERDAGTRTDGVTTDEREELARLRRENRRLTEDVEILRRATAFFAKEIR